jgi:hypothetical protein
MRRDLFAREALAEIPKILTLQDRNPHSPTYGCFDRNFWHYRILDFPSGMAQELVWPLALAHALDAPDNPYHGDPAVREWVEAGIRFAARSAHSDGSCDDYFPYERAGGAAAFSLLACLESCRLLGIADAEISLFVERRAEWLSLHHESGRLTNHQALIALGLELAGRELGTSRWEARRDERLARVLAWQSPEGWFQEYEGCDPGYHTLTVSVLARLEELRPDPRVRAALERAVAFTAELVHPDGSYGGELGSRNTYNFFPHGFELAGRWLPEALAVNDRVLEGLARGLGACHADDHILGHHAWNYLLAWRDFVPSRPVPAAHPPGRVWFREAGLLVDRRQGVELHAALKKGGVFKLFRDGRLAASDTHVSLLVGEAGGRHPRNAVAHLVGDSACEVDLDEIAIQGSLGWAKHVRMTPLRMVALRLFMLAGGRLFPDLVRRLLQRALVTGRTIAPFTFRRTFTWVAGKPAAGARGRWRVTDEVRGDWSRVVAAGIGASQTSIANVMSRTYQAGQLQPWLDLTRTVRSLAPGEPLRLEREP